MLDMSFEIKYFSKDKEWRLYRDNGQYIAFKDLEHLPAHVLQHVSAVVKELQDFIKREGKM